MLQNKYANVGKDNMKKRTFINCLLFMVIVLLIICTFNHYHELFNLHNVNAKSLNENKTLAINDNQIDFLKLRQEYNNDEIIGLLKIPNTKINELITQATDNKKYLTKNIYNERDIIGNPFLDYRVKLEESPNKILIYGHNSITYDTPFRELEDYYDKDYYDDHQYVELITEQGLWRYKIFSIYIETQDWSYMNLEYDNSDEWLDHLERLRMKSIYDTGESVSQDDSILIIQTCSFKEEFANYNKKYLLIIARRVD